MKSFFWRIFICVVPVLLAGLITSNAVNKYRNGIPGGFKLGVDLEGGTILVYEIDIRKQLQDEKKYEPQRDTNLLAESLKRRIDPNDLYNIVIRPAGGEGRVEIILPTGGRYREEKAQQAWDKLLDDMKTIYGEKVEVGRGHVQELADRIHTTLSEKTWREKVYNNRADWNDLWNKGLANWARLSTPVALVDSLPDRVSLASAVGQMGIPGDRSLVGLSAYITQIQLRSRKAKFDQLAPGKFETLIEFFQGELGAGTTEKDIEAWLKKEVWKHMLTQARKKWKDLEPYTEEMNAIDPDSNEQLISFIQSQGNVIGQGTLVTLEPLLGSEDVVPKAPPAAEIAQFIQDHYGPSRQKILQDIEVKTRETNRTKDMTVEDVQRIKELVAKVGNLEFRILANSLDDEKAIKEATDQLNNTAKSKKDDWATKGLAPPGPYVPNTEELKVFDLNLPRNNKSSVTYSWVELGPQERAQLGLQNSFGKDPSKAGSTWREAKVKRNEAAKLPDPGFAAGSGRFLLQGSLFYSRECQDRNLPEEERTKKTVEYFILTRNPEIDPNDPQKKKETPRIDGRYLISASSDNREGRPAVHFTFNATGGDLFGNLTRKNVPSGSGSEDSQVRRHLAIILDGLVMTAPTINSEIRTQGQITGKFSMKEVESLVNILRSGALPASLKPQPVSESTMGATLGQDTIEKGVWAVIWAFAVVVLFMILYYRFSGLVASAALFANLILTVGFMIFVQATFTLPGLAGLVLMLGMAIDANILIYERLREERERGASLALAIRNGYDRAFPTIIDTHLSSIFTAIVLYIVGNDQLKGFGVSLTAGLIISLFTSLYMTRLIFDIWLHQNWLKKLSMFRVFHKPDFDFMGPRFIFFTLTIVASVLGIGIFIGRLPNDLDIDFVGGTAYTGQLTKAVNINELRGFLHETSQKERLQVVEVKETDTVEKIVVDETTKKEEVKIVGGNSFDIVYQDPGGQKTKRSVILANKALGASPQQREEAVKARAKQLPDIGVVQIFPSSIKTEGNKSPVFTIRTSEKEVELVQAAIDRLLTTVDEGQLKPLLKNKFIWVDPVTFKSTKLRFYVKDPAEYEKQSGMPFDPTTVDQDKKEDAKEEKDKPWPRDFASASFFKTLFTRELYKVFHIPEKTAKGEKSELPFKLDLIGEGKTNQDGRHHLLKLTFSPDLTSDQLAKVQSALINTKQAFQNRPQPDQLENFDSQLAAETRLRAMWAILASWGAIAMYLWFRFGNWTFGLAAVLCLVHDLFFTMGIIASCYFLHGTLIGNALLLEDFKLDLTAVAALLTLVGYSVNDTIVVFDRIREVRGKNPDLTPNMINDSVNQTLSRTLLTSFVTWLVVIVLYIWGGPGVHLFAFVMVVGVIVGTYSSIYIASPLLLMFGEGTRSAALSRGPERRPEPQPQGAPMG